MNLNEKEIEYFKSLAGTAGQRILVSVIQRKKSELFLPETLTVENLGSRKDAARLIDEIVDLITLTNPDKEVDPNQYI